MSKKSISWNIHKCKYFKKREMWATYQIELDLMLGKFHRRHDDKQKRESPKR